MVMIFLPDVSWSEGFLMHIFGPLEHLMSYTFSPDADQKMKAAMYLSGLISTLVQIAIVLTGCIVLIRRARGATAPHVRPAQPRAPQAK